MIPAEYTNTFSVTSIYVNSKQSLNRFVLGHSYCIKKMKRTINGSLRSPKYPI